jgi:hypothetical protein
MALPVNPLFREIIASALRRKQPDLALAMARRIATAIVRRIFKAGYAIVPSSRERIVLLREGNLECMNCRNQYPLAKIPGLRDLLSERGRRRLGLE